MKELIEKLEALKVEAKKECKLQSNYGSLAYWEERFKAFQECIALIRQHEARTPQAEEVDEREAFEKWAADHFSWWAIQPDILFCLNDDSDYAVSNVREAFRGWQARAALPAKPVAWGIREIGTNREVSLEEAMECRDSSITPLLQKDKNGLWSGPVADEILAQNAKPVDLEKCARAIFEVRNPNSSWSEVTKFDKEVFAKEPIRKQYFDSAKACLAAAGITFKE